MVSESKKQNGSTTNRCRAHPISVLICHIRTSTNSRTFSKFNPISLIPFIFRFLKILFWTDFTLISPRFHPNEQFQHSFEEALTTSVMHHLIPRKQFLADQCAANAIFHHNPEKMYLLPCKWNLRRVLNHITTLRVVRSIYFWNQCRKETDPTYSDSEIESRISRSTQWRHSESLHVGSVSFRHWFQS